MPEALYCRCPNGHEFKSMIQIDRQTFEAVNEEGEPNVNVEGNNQGCPRCGVPVLISKASVFFKDG